MKIINFFKLFTSHFLGEDKYCLSTLSKGKVICPKSYNKLCTSSCIGVIGKNGSSILATITEKTSPKLKLVAILIYFMILQKVFLPSVTPSKSTFKSFSSNIMSADSLDMSTAVSTEIPTSELISEGLSLIPSPIYPTILPFSFNNLTILAF
ncbi:hypothetical protein D3C72_1270620 [compost metagenome]